jgi:hypothetical protein
MRDFHKELVKEIERAAEFRADKAEEYPDDE